MGKRFEFKCWNCQKTYTLAIEITNDQTLIVACPYCNKEGIVDLDPLRKDLIPVHLDVECRGQAPQTELVMPGIVPTRKP